MVFHCSEIGLVFVSVVVMFAMVVAVIVLYFYFELWREDVC